MLSGNSSSQHCSFHLYVFLFIIIVLIFILEFQYTLTIYCQVAIPIGKYNEHPISISFITYHGGDKFLLDTVLDLYDSLQEQVNIASNLVPLPDTNGSIDASELLKEKVDSSLLWQYSGVYSVLLLVVGSLAFFCYITIPFLFISLLVIEILTVYWAQPQCRYFNNCILLHSLLKKKKIGQFCLAGWNKLKLLYFKWLTISATHSVTLLILAWYLNYIWCQKSIAECVFCKLNWFKFFSSPPRPIFNLFEKCGGRTEVTVAIVKLACCWT